MLSASCSRAARGSRSCFQPSSAAASSRRAKRSSSSRLPPAKRASQRLIFRVGPTFNAGDIYYGFPDLEARGFKIAHDAHGPAIDPDGGDRIATAAGLADVRGYLARRFPALSDAPLVESRVCQYENSANGDLLIDRHPLAQNVWLVGAGSGHGFKHGPEVGRLAADLALSNSAAREPRFSLAAKAKRQQRSVH